MVAVPSVAGVLFDPAPQRLVVSSLSEVGLLDLAGLLELAA